MFCLNEIRRSVLIEIVLAQCVYGTQNTQNDRFLKSAVPAEQDTESVQGHTGGETRRRGRLDDHSVLKNTRI